MLDLLSQFETTRLRNGLQVYACYIPDHPAVLRIVNRSGSRYDPPGREGLTHFFEHVAFENTTLPPRGIEEFFEECGGSLEGPDESSIAGTNFSQIEVGCLIPAQGKILAGALDIFGGMLITCRVKKGVVQERRAILGEFRRDYPQDYIYQDHVRKHAMLHHDSEFCRVIDPLGPRATIKKITADDLQRWHDKESIPENLFVVCIGGLRLQELVNVLDGSPFAANKTGTVRTCPRPLETLAAPLEYDHRSKRPGAKKEDGGEYRSFVRLPGTLPYETRVLFERIFRKVALQTLREEKQWTYGASLYPVDLGDFTELQIRCEDVDFVALDDIGPAVDACIERIGRDEHLFQQERRRMLAGFSTTIPTVFDTCESAADTIAVRGEIRTWAASYEQLTALTMDDMRTMAELMQPERRWSYVIHP